jgi:hypothetical protein
MKASLIDVELVFDVTMATVRHLEESGLTRAEERDMAFAILRAGIEAALIAHFPLVLRKLANSEQSVN